MKSPLPALPSMRLSFTRIDAAPSFALAADTPRIATARITSGFYSSHLFAPLLAYGLLVCWLAPLHGDLQLADWLFSLQGDRWALRDGFITESVVHVAGKHASAAAWLCVAGAWLASLVRPSLDGWRRPLGYLTVSTLGAALLVAWLKSRTDIDCPWDLARYGGRLDYVGLFEPRPAGRADAACFPAGHASAGYAWVSLYFFLRAVRPRRRWRGLAAGLGLGLLFGISQQLRGAHFLSHDLTTLLICWLTALGLYGVMLRPARDITL